MNLINKLRQNAAYLIIACSNLFLLYIAISWEGTGDDGDSVQHYQYARWAFAHPENFYVQWAKPIYVFITAPIAQFGFTAIKVFNVLLFGATQYLAFATAKKLEVKNTWLVPLFMVLAPMELYLAPSGLTEPLWAFWFMLTVYLAVNERLILATLVLSFLPFVRSEGLIIFCLFVPYLFVKRRYFLVPLLAVGHLVYMFAGAKYYDDNIWWVFTKLSYATLESGYGSGTLFHFVDQLRFFMGGSMRFFLGVGYIYGTYRLIQYWLGNAVFRKEELWLIYGCSAAYFIGHSLFWVLGIFNSFGLPRVMVGIMPAFAIVLTNGFSFIWEKIKERDTRFGWLFVVIALGFILKSSLKHINRGSFWYSCDQLSSIKAINAFKEEAENSIIYYDNTSIGHFMETDYFSDIKHRHCDRLINGEPVPANALIFWDSWFSRSEHKVPLEKLQNDPRFKQVGAFNECGESWIYVFKRDTSVTKITNLLYFDDFEKQKEGLQQDNTIHFSGQNAAVLNKKVAYLSSFEGILNNLRNKNGNVKIKISSKVWLNEIVANYDPMLVIEVIGKSGGKLWKAFSVNKQIKQLKQWNDFHQIYVFDLDVKPTDILKVYFWNDSENKLYLDDCKVEIVD